MQPERTPDALPRAELPRSLASRVAERIARSRDPVARLRAGRTLELYYEAGDAHSQLAAAQARRLLPRLKVPLVVRPVPAPPPDTYPEAERQRAFAAQDAARLAPCHGLPAPLALSAERACLDAWAADRPLPAGPAADGARTQTLLRANAARRRRLGHYLPAMWQYRGIDTHRAEAHRDALFAAGLWGVPSFRLGAFTTWGQDRLWMLQRLAIQGRSDRSPGI